MLDDDAEDYVEIAAIHDERGYRQVREALSLQYNLSHMEPNIQIWEADIRGDRSLTLQHIRHDRRPLADQESKEVLKHLHRLWQFDVHLDNIDNGQVVSRWSIPEPRQSAS